MEALPETAAPVNAMPQGERRYQTVNGSWPKDPPRPNGQEAIRGAKLLYRKFMGHAWRGTWKLTSGRRHTRAMRGVFYVNPHEYRDHGGGWRAIVHSMSHHVHHKKTPAGITAHDSFGRHAFLEREMVAYVVESGWLEGKLKSQAKPKVVQDVKTVRYQSVLARIAKWESKAKRAATALKKLRRQKTYYEKQVAN